MIAIRNIMKRYDQVPALKGVTFSVTAGELCGLLGPNGAGKSTLFKIIMGLVLPDSGEILFQDTPIDWGDYRYKSDLGYAPEIPALYEYLTGREFLNFVAAAKKINVDQQTPEIDQWLDFFKLMPKADELITGYSNGMRRKISLCAAMLGKPRMLFLDEATNGLDPETSYYFKIALKDYCKAGGTVLFSSHIIETIEQICDRIVILHQGEVLREFKRSEWQAFHAHGSSLEQEFIRLID